MKSLLILFFGFIIPSWSQVPGTPSIGFWKKRGCATGSQVFSYTGSA